MKCAIAAALLCLLCLGHTNGQKLKAFCSGNEYEYTYLGQALTGLPDNSPQQAGLALKAKVVIQATQPETLKVKIVKLEMATINSVLETVDLESQSYQWQSAREERFIRSPMTVNMKNGAVDSFVTSGDEPDTVTNLKKAILTAIQLQVKQFPSPHSASSRPSSQYSNGKYASLAAYKSRLDEDIRSDNNDLFAVYSVMEDDVAGNCETRYIASSQPWVGNPNGQVINVTKIDDYENCEDDDGPRDWLLSNVAPNNCTDCESDDMDMVNTVKVTDYDVRVEHGCLVIDRIESVAETVYTPLTANSDEIRTNHTQIFILRHVRQITEPIPEPTNPEHHEDLEYDFPGLNGTEPTNEELVNRPAQFVPHDGRQFPEAVRRLVKEITHDLQNNPQTPMDNTPFKALECARAWKTLPRSEISNLYNELIAPGSDNSRSEDALIQRRVGLDTLLMSGTVPAHSLLISKIAKQEITGEEANKVLAAIATQITRPVAPLINQLQKLCESEVANRDEQVHTTCWMTFASLVDQSCSEDNSTLAVSPDLETYCNDSQARQFIQALSEQLDNADRKEEQLMFIYAMSIISREEIVQVLRPYASGQRPVHESVRVLAIYVISDIESDEVLDILEPILFDTDEESFPRVAAFSAIVTNSPDEQLIAKLALLTTDGDDQVASFAMSTIEQYANASHPCLSEMSAQAAKARRFAEDTSYGIQDSQAGVSDTYDDDTDSGAILEWAYANSNDSLIPRGIDVSLKRIISGFETQPFGLMAQLEGIQSIVDRTIGPKATFGNLSLRDILRKSYSGKSQKQYNQQGSQGSQLNIEPLDDEPLSVAIKLQMQNNAHRFVHIDADTVKNAIESALSSRSATKLTSGEGLKLNYQALTNAGSVLYQTVSCLGLPIVVSFQAPIAVDLKSKVSVQINQGSSSSIVPQEISVQADLTPTVSINMITVMGTVNPFTKQCASAGVTSKTFLTLPFHVSAKLEIAEARLTTKVVPLAPIASSNMVKLFSYKVKPFTAIYPYQKFETIANSAKLITEKDTPDEYKFDLGSEVTGIPTQLQVKSCMFWQDQGSLLSYLFEDNDLLSHAMLWWATPDFKHREYKLIADANAAKSTEITTVIDIDYLPSKFQRILRQRQRDLKGSLAFFLGWTALPWQCELKSHDKSTMPNYPEEPDSSDLSWQSQRGSSGGQRNYNNDQDEDDDNDNDDDQQTRGAHRRPYGRSANHAQDDLDQAPEQTSRQWQYSSDSSSGSSSSNSGSRQLSSSVQKFNLQHEDADDSVRVKLDVAVKGQVSRAVRSVTTFTRNKLRMTDHMEAKIDFRNPPFTSKDKLQICASTKVAYPTLPCDVPNSLNPENAKPIKAQATLTYGEMCPLGSQSGNHITMDAVFSKDEEQKENEAAGNHWYLRECAKNYQNDQRITSACLTAMSSMANMNKEVYDAKYNNVPDCLVNATRQVEDFFKYLLYSHMSNNPVNVNNGEGRIRIHTTYDSQAPTVDVQVYKPKENTFFENINTEDFPLLPPMNARQSFLKMYLKDLMNGDAPPTCQVMKHDIESFENVTYAAPLTDCKHVLTQDCSETNLFTVLASQIDGGAAKELEVQLLYRNIVARPTGAGAHHGQFAVTIDNDMHVTPSPNVPIVVTSTSPESEGKVLAFIVLVGEMLHIRAPHHMMWIKFDGQNIKIELSNTWRGEVCGMCGQMTGNSDDPLVGPDQCSYADEQDFALAYAVRDGKCSAPEPSDKKTCPDDNDNDNNQGQQGQDDNDDDDNDDESARYSVKKRWGKSFDEPEGAEYKKSASKMDSAKQQSPRQWAAQARRGSQGSQYGRGDDDDDDDDNDDPSDDWNNNQDRDQNRGKNQDNDDDDDDDDDDDVNPHSRSAKASKANRNDDDNDDDNDDLPSSRSNKRHSGGYGHGHGHDDYAFGPKYSRKDPLEFELLVKYRNGKVCFSKYPVSKCKPGYRPKVVASKPIAFRCYSVHSALAEHLKGHPSQQQLSSHAASNADFTETETIITECH